MIWVINGIPGVGKSTTARALAQTFARGVHIEGDRLQEMIVSGGVGPGGTPLAEEQRQIHLNVRHQCLLARSFAGDGFEPVLDYIVVNRERLLEYQSYLGALPLALVTLCPRPDIALQRDQLRTYKTVGDRWVHLADTMRQQLTGVGLWLDTSTMTVDETVNQILASQEQARVL